MGIVRLYKYATLIRGFKAVYRLQSCKHGRGNKTPTYCIRARPSPRPAAGRPPQKQTISTAAGLSAGVWLLTNVKLIYFSNLMLKVCEGVYAGKLSAL